MCNNHRHYYCSKCQHKFIRTLRLRHASLWSRSVTGRRRRLWSSCISMQPRSLCCTLLPLPNTYFYATWHLLGQCLKLKVLTQTVKNASEQFILRYSATYLKHSIRRTRSRNLLVARIKCKKNHCMQHSQMISEMHICAQLLTEVKNRFKS